MGHRVIDFGVAKPLEPLQQACARSSINVSNRRISPLISSPAAREKFVSALADSGSISFSVVTEMVRKGTFMLFARRFG
jgi:hypothetical protein